MILYESLLKIYIYIYKIVTLTLTRVKPDKQIKNIFQHY